MTLHPERVRRIGSIAVTLALLSCVRALYQAVHVQRTIPLPDPESETLDLSTRESRLTAAALTIVVESNPFHPDRQPVQPEVDDAPPAQPEPEPEEIPPFRLVGTAQTPGGGVAVIQLPGSEPALIRIGGEIGGFVLTRVDRGSVSVTRGDRAIDLHVPSPGSLPVAGPAEMAGARGAGSSTGQQSSATMDAQRIVQEILRRGGQARVSRDTSGGAQ